MAKMASMDVDYIVDGACAASFPLAPHPLPSFYVDSTEMKKWIEILINHLGLQFNIEGQSSQY